MSKKSLGLLTSLLLLGLLFCGCENHSHEYLSQNTVPPTCEETGSILYTCACGDSYTEELPSVGEHIWNTGTSIKDATCAESGIIIYTCTACGTTKEDATAASEQHNWGNPIVTKEPTCLETGVTTITCNVCKEEKTETLEKSTTHTWDNGNETKIPTCSELGEKTYICTVCSTTKTEDVPATNNHTWNNGTVTLPPTTEKEGEKTYSCTICNEQRKESIAKIKTIASGTMDALNTDIIETDSSMAKNLRWTLTEDGVLTISGTGAMPDYWSMNMMDENMQIVQMHAHPWQKHMNQIQKVVIEEGCTLLGNMAFYGCDNLLEIHVPASVTEVRDSAFGSRSDTKVYFYGNAPKIGNIYVVTLYYIAGKAGWTSPTYTVNETGYKRECPTLPFVP